MKSLSWPQVLLTVAGLAAIAFAHQAGPAEGTLVSAGVALLFWLREPPPSDTGTKLKGVALAFLPAAVIAHLVACAGTLSPAQEVEVGQTTLQLADCTAQARLAPDGGHVHALHQCEQEAGLELTDGGTP